MYYESFNSLLEDLDNDFELMDEIIQDLENLIQETKVNIDDGLKKQDAEIVGGAIHKLKGALLNFRIVEEVKLLDTAEAECRSKNLSGVENTLKIVYNNLIQLSLDYKRYCKDNNLA